MKFRVREREDDRENRPADVAEKDGQKGRNLPIFPDTNDDVEIATELVAGVECEEPELADEDIGVPDIEFGGPSGSCGIRASCNNGRDDGTYGIEPYTCSNTRGGAIDTVR